MARPALRKPPHVTITSTADLLAAIISAPDNSTIAIPAGTYPGLSVVNVAKNNLVLDGSAGAVLAGTKLTGSSGMSFQGFDFDPNPNASQTIESNMVTVKTSSGIVFQNNTFAGDIMLSLGLSVSQSNNVQILSNTFSSLYDAIAIGLSDTVLVDLNEGHDIRRDWCDVGGSNITISRNLTHDFHHLGQSGQTDPATGQPGDHSDAMGQLTGTVTNLVVKSNAYFCGANPPISQQWGTGGKNSDGLMFNQPTASTGRHQNITVQNNLFVGTTYTAGLFTYIDGFTDGGNWIIGQPDPNNANNLPHWRIQPDVTGYTCPIPNIQMVASQNTGDLIVPPMAPDLWATFMRLTACRQNPCFPPVT